MEWIRWALAGWFTLGTLITIGQIGKPKEPTTPRLAGTVAVMNVLIIAGLFLI